MTKAPPVCMQPFHLSETMCDNSISHIRESRIEKREKRGGGKRGEKRKVKVGRRKEGRQREKERKERGRKRRTWKETVCVWLSEQKKEMKEQGRKEKKREGGRM